MIAKNWPRRHTERSFKRIAREFTLASRVRWGHNDSQGPRFSCSEEPGFQSACRRTPNFLDKRSPDDGNLPEKHSQATPSSPDARMGEPLGSKNDSYVMELD